jgi:hypothetical protein
MRELIATSALPASTMPANRKIDAPRACGIVAISGVAVVIESSLFTGIPSRFWFRVDLIGFRSLVGTGRFWLNLCSLQPDMASQARRGQQQRCKRDEKSNH